MPGDADNAMEPIGDVQTLYDGRLLPDLQVGAELLSFPQERRHALDRVAAAA